jgi:hypothetical protein
MDRMKRLLSPGKTAVGYLPSASPEMELELQRLRDDMKKK